MEITFLGTGTSTGVPEIGCNCEVCQSKDPRDKRLRASSLITVNNKNILIDCGPDFRSQMLNNKIDRINSVLLTHHHYDHLGGIDDLRPFGREHEVDIFGEDYVTETIHRTLPYAFVANKYPGVPRLSLHTIDTTPFETAGIPITPIRIMHAKLPILGYRIGNMAYLTDVKTIPKSEISKLKDLDLLIINALRKEPHLSHLCVEEALKYVDMIKPKKTYFIHMCHRIGLHQDIENLYQHLNVYFAYDSLHIKVH